MSHSTCGSVARLSAGYASLAMPILHLDATVISYAERSELTRDQSLPFQTVKDAVAHSAAWKTTTRTPS